MKMSDLAKLAGVSKSTVSRALADNEKVSLATRLRIQRLAEEHNYVMDTRARNFRLKEILTIGVLLPSDGTENWLATNPFTLEMLGVIADELEKYGHELLLAKHSTTDPSWIKEFIKNRGVDGYIVLGQSIFQETLQEIGLSTDKMVVWGAQLPHQSYTTVGSDNYLGGRLVAEHLMAQGRKRFGCIGNTHVPETKLRYQGYRDALLEANSDFKPVRLGCSENKCRDATQLIENLLSNDLAIDALFASSDMLAIQTIKAFKSHNIRTPQDISIVGYDDISIAEFISPTLTSINQNRTIAGKLLVKKLLARINGEDVESEIIPTELMIRESS